MDNTNIFKPDINDPTILVADDSDVIRTLLEKLFADKYRILMVGNGYDTIDVIEANMNNNIVWVILDLNMPGAGGYKVLTYFKEKKLFDRIPVTVISGDNSEDTFKRVHEFDVVDLLIKPFKVQDIQESMRKALNITIPSNESDL